MDMKNQVCNIEFYLKCDRFNLIFPINFYPSRYILISTYYTLTLYTKSHRYPPTTPTIYSIITILQYQTPIRYTHPIPNPNTQLPKSTSPTKHK